MHRRNPTPVSFRLVSPSSSALPLLHLFLFNSQRSLTLTAFSAAVHPKYQKAEEHCDSHEGDGRRGGEELPVVDAEVPHDGQYHHEHGHHQAAGANGDPRSPEPPRRPRPSPRPCRCLASVLRTGLVQGLGDVAVDHAVVRDVQGQQRLLGILKQLSLVDEFYLMLPT